jgi:hypothetical protein
LTEREVSSKFPNTGRIRVVQFSFVQGSTTVHEQKNVKKKSEKKNPVRFCAWCKLPYEAVKKSPVATLAKTLTKVSAPSMRTAGKK